MFYVFDQDSVTACIDYNHDTEFSDEEQIIFTKLDNTSKSATGTFTVPNDALINKNLRLRVRSQYYTNPMDACINSPGEVEDYTIKLKKPEVNNVQTIGTPHISITPNPTNGIFEIRIGEIDHTQVNIIDVTGKIVHQLQGYTDSFVVNKDIPQGSYIIQVITSKGSSVKKLIVQ